uniref:Uncharacterized protein n=1 Tax=Arundo donax TaxID=35708 RepID=A0A0A9TN83_ARUDO
MSWRKGQKWDWAEGGWEARVRSMRLYPAEPTGWPAAAELRKKASAREGSLERMLRL